MCLNPVATVLLVQNLVEVNNKNNRITYLLALCGEIAGHPGIPTKGQYYGKYCLQTYKSPLMIRMEL